MARLLNIGFEQNSVSNGGETVTNGSPTTSTSVVYSGTYSLALDPAAASGIVPILYASATATTIFTSQRYYMAGNPGNAMNPIQVRNGSSIVSRIAISTAGLITLRNSANGTVGNSFTASLNQWLQFELMHDATTNPGSLELRVRDSSGNLLFSTSGANDVQGQFTNIRVGSAQVNVSQFYMDDVIVNDSTGSFENTWVGNQRLAWIQPSGAGDSSQWLNTAAAAGGAGNFALIRERPHNDATTMVQSGTLNDVDLYSFDNPSEIKPNDTITCVTLNSRARNNVADATTAVTYQLEKTTGGTKTSSSAYIPNTNTWLTNHNPTANPMTPVIVAHQDPDAASWTPATVSSLQAGVKITAANVNRIQVSTLWIYVSYIPAARTRTLAGARTKAGTRTLAGARTLSGIRTSLTG
jgi:hypothetical protein